MSDETRALPAYLVRVAPSRDGLARCDYEDCFASEVEDIVDGTGTELRPVYLDTRYDVRICRKCVEAGKHLIED